MLNAKVDSFLAPNTTGNQAISGLGFQPKVVIFLWNRLTAAASSIDATIGFGVGVSSSERRAGGNYSTTNAAPSSNVAWNQNTTCIYNPSASHRADLVSLDSDGFTINWLSASDMRVYYLALGGSDLTNVKAGTAAAKTTTGTQAYTGVGFQPTCLIVFAGKFGADALDGATQGNALFGFASGSTERGLIAWRNQNAQNPQIAKHRQSNAKLVSHTTNFTEADLVSFDTDGFTLNFTLAGGTADIFYYLALRGPTFKVAAFNQPTSTGNQALTGAGFQPRAALMISANDIAANNDAAQSHARASLGMVTDTTHRVCLWTGDTDNVSPSVASRDVDNAKVLKMLTESATTPSVNSAADHVSFDSDGQTINWTTTDATARQFLTLWMGDAASQEPSLGSISMPQFLME